MASKVEIVNVALTLLGESRIMSIDDDVKAAREAKAVYDIVRDALLANYNWTFAKQRVSLPALVSVPAFQYSKQYKLPVDCLRLVFVGDYYVGASLADYRTIPDELYAIEGGMILTDLSAPLNIKFVARVTDTTQFAPAFTMAFASKLAMSLVEPLSQSAQKYQIAEAQFRDDLRLAIRSNAIEQPPIKLPDDEWLLARL